VEAAELEPSRVSLASLALSAAAAEAVLIRVQPALVQTAAATAKEAAAVWAEMPQATAAAAAELFALST
jgi:hypothetical protein